MGNTLRGIRIFVKSASVKPFTFSWSNMEMLCTILPWATLSKKSASLTKVLQGSFRPFFCPCFIKSCQVLHWQRNQYYCIRETFSFSSIPYGKKSFGPFCNGLHSHMYQDVHWSYRETLSQPFFNPL